MTVTHALARATPDALIYLFDHDAGGGDVDLLANAEMLADSLAGPLHELLLTDFNPNSTALQQSRLLGDATGLATQDMTNLPHATVAVAAQGPGLAVNFLLDADVDGAAALRGEYNITTSSGVAGIWLVKIQFSHTLTR